jgi:hypothetical protein
MQPGNESIHRQNDVAITALITRDINEAYNVLKIKLGNIEGSSHRDVSMKSYERFNKQLKTSMLDATFKKISRTLSKRFGINIQLEYIRSHLTNLSTVVMPPINYKTMNIVLNCLDDMFPKKRANSTIWETMAGDREKKIYNIFNDLKNGFENGNINIDLKDAYITGLDGSIFVITLDLLGAKTLDLSPEEVTAILIQQVGKIFSYIEYITATTDSTKVLTDTFLKERFGKSKDPIDALRLAIEATDVDVEVDTSTPIKTLESLDSFILKTYRIDKTTANIKVDFERMPDIFTTRFGLGDTLASSLIKLASITVDTKHGVTYVSSVTETTILTILGLIAIGIAFILFSIVGLFIMAIYITIKLVSYAAAMVSRFIAKFIALILQTGDSSTVTTEDLTKRLTRIKLELIRELRTTKTSETGKELIVEQIEFIKDSITGINGKLSILGKFSNSTSSLNYSKMEDINFLTEQLQESELYLMQEKFNIKG